MAPWPKFRRLVASRREEVWAGICFAIAAVLGLLANVLVERRLGLSGVGSLNLSLSIVLILGQVSCRGIHSAVAFLVPMAITRGENPTYVTTLAVTIVKHRAIALSVALAAGCVVGVALGQRGALFPLALCTLPAIVCFSVNKVLLAHFNGVRDALFAPSGNALRFGFLAVSASAITASVGGDAGVAMSVVSSEFLTMIVLIWKFSKGRQLRDRERKDSSSDLEVNLELKKFGKQSFASAVIIDLNSRVDVICLALLSSSSEVGRYSIAVFFAEALFQLAFSWRIAIEPRVAPHLVKRDQAGLLEFLRRKRKDAYITLGPIGALSLVLYSPATSILYGPSANGTLPLYLILGVAVSLVLGFLPQLFLSQQLGEPRLQRKILMRMFLTNLAVNVVLVPILGAPGSAIGLAISLLTLVPSTISLERQIRETW